MLAPSQRRPGRIYPWAGVGLLLLFGSLTAYDLSNRYFPLQRVVSNPELVEELGEAKHVPEAPAAAEPGEWPQWRGPRRDGVSTETGLFTSWPKEGPRVLWRVHCSEGFSSLAVAGGRAYTLLRQDPVHEAVVCWDAATGLELWRFPYSSEYHHSYGSGPRSTPTVQGGHVYTVGATGIFLCLEAATGKEVWRHDLLREFQAPLPEWGVSFSPLVEGDLVFTSPGGPGGNSLAAFAKKSGALVWKTRDDPAGYSSPIAVTAAGVRQVIFLTGTSLVSVSPAEGRLYWCYPWKTDYHANVATPIFFRAGLGNQIGDYLFISSDYGKGCALLKVLVDARGLPRVAKVYETNRMRNKFSSSVLYREHLYGFDEEYLVCLEIRTGNVAWKQRGFRRGSLLVADGLLIILGENGKLALADATPEGYREKAAWSFAEQKCWTAPVLAGGRLYLRDEKQVVCLSLKEEERVGR
jgi:outer membrane protein assembly factor BamB